MFAKLLKYDMRATKRFALPLILALMGVTIVASIAGYLLTMYISMDVPETDLNAILKGLSAMALLIGSFLVTMLMSAASTVVVVLVCVRFYRNLISDEGYLTFTLPVKNYQIINSKLLSGFIWIVLVSIALFLGIGLVFFVSGLGAADSLPASLGSIFADLKIVFMQEIAGSEVWLVILMVQALLSALIQTLFQLIAMYTAIFFSSTIAKKHKPAAAVLGVFAVNIIIGVFTQLVSSIIIPLFITAVTLGDVIISHNLSFAFMNVVYLGAGVGLYFFLKHLMDKRLNLS